MMFINDDLQIFNICTIHVNDSGLCLLLNETHALIHIIYILFCTTKFSVFPDAIEIESFRFLIYIFFFAKACIFL